MLHKMNLKKRSFKNQIYEINCAERDQHCTALYKG